MTRWWADADQARDVLGRVDASDIEQGVGTAVLGYHALAAERLAPLSQRTLVDVSQVVRALEQVDLEPVAKALGEATRPVMGPAADRYGELLASDLHQQAVSSTERLVMNLSSTGMPFPTAISRALAVHGLPEDRMGRVHLRLRQPVIQPLALDDAADRALMEYASHVGRREASGASVSKAGAQQEQWDESEVNRDAGGRFAREAERADRASRLARRKELKDRGAKRRAVARGRLERKEAAEQAVQAKTAPQAMNMEERLAARRAQQETGADSQLQSRVNERLKSRVNDRLSQRVKARRDAYLKKLLESPDELPPPPKHSMKDLSEYPMYGDTYQDAHWSHLRNDRYYYVVTPELLNKIAQDKGFSVESLANATGSRGYLIAPTHESEVPNQLSQHLMNQGGMGVGLIVWNRDIALTNDFTAGDTFVTLANQGVYSIQNPDVDGGIRFGEEHGAKRVLPGTSQKIPAKVAYIEVQLENQDNFQFHVDKADKPWDETEVERDARGRFAEEDSRATRLARRKELKRRGQKRRERTARLEQTRVTQTMDLTERLKARGEAKAAEVAAMTDSQKQALNDRLKDRLADRVKARLDDRVKARIRQRNEERLNAEKDLESLYTIQFDTDDAALPDWFGVGGFDGPDFTGGPEDDFEEQLIKDTIRAQVKPAWDVMWGIHDTMNSDKKAFESGVAAYDKGSAFFYDVTDAQAMAESWLEDNEAFVKKPGFTVIPYTEEMTHSHYGQGFESRWALVPENPTRTLVFGSKKDFQRILDGEDFEAARMGGGSANVWFDTIFARSVPKEDYMARVDKGRRPDFKVRAFRIRMRENDPDRD